MFFAFPASFCYRSRAAQWLCRPRLTLNSPLPIIRASISKTPRLPPIGYAIRVETNCALS